MKKLDTQKIKDKVKSTNIRAIRQRTQDGKLHEIKKHAEGEQLAAIKAARKKIVQGTSVAVVLVSILTGLAFSGPSEITADQTTTQINPPPIVMDIGDYANATVDEDDDEDAACEKKGFARFVQKFKQAVLSLPKAVRILIVVPLWAIGTGITTAMSLMWRFITNSPVGGFLLSTLIGFAVLLGLYVVTAKVLFPELPIKKILCKKSVIAIATVSVVLGLADAIVPLFWSKYPLVAAAVKLTTALLTVSILTSRLKRLNLAKFSPLTA